MLRCLILAPSLMFVSKMAAFGNETFKPEDGFVKIFDGKTLAGWHTNRDKISHGTGGRWIVEDGVLTGEQDPPGSGNGGVLLSDKKYGDFELELELAPDWNIDSGVFLRTNERGECFQIYVDHRQNGLIGFVSTEGKKRMYIRPFCIKGVFDEKKNLIGYETAPDGRKEAWGDDFLRYHCSPEEWLRAWKVGEWNHLRVRCVGKYPRITTWINGVKIADFDGETCPSPLYRKYDLEEQLGREGYIGFQVHGGKGWRNGAKCRWRNIRIKEL